MTKRRSKRYTLSILAVLVVAAIMAAFVVTNTFAQENPSCAVDNYVWVGNGVSNSVSKIDKATNTVEATIPGVGYAGIAVDDKSVWTANYSTSTASKINKATNTVEATINVGKVPIAVAVDDKYAWVANMGDWGPPTGTVSKIDKATNLVVKVIALNQSAPDCITVDDKYVWVGNGISNSVSKIDKATDTVVQTIDLNPYTTPNYEGIRYGPWGITVDENYVWVSNHRSYSVSKIDKITGNVVATIDIRIGLTYAWVTGVAVDDRYLWASISAWAGYPNALFKIDKTSNAILATINGVGELYGPLIDKDYVWAVYRSSGTILKINKITNQIVATVSGFNGGPIINGDGTGYNYDKFMPCIHPPVAVANPGLDGNGSLILDGTGSSDPDGTIVSWDWVLANRDPQSNNFNLTGNIVSTNTVDTGIYDVTLTVTDNDGLTGTDTTELYVPTGLGVCSELQTLTDEIMETLGVTSQDEIVLSISGLQNQIQVTNDTLTTNLGSVEADFQSIFNDPTFIIPGDTLIEKFEALSQAISDLNNGRKEGIYVNLGGKSGRGR